MSIYQTIKNILDIHQIVYDEISHESSMSCEHSKILRNQAGLSGIGSKNIIFHAKGNFYLVTTLGDKEIKARKFKKEFGTKDIRFATQEEITSLGLGVIGSISPFGFQNNSIPLYVDDEIFTHEYFMFNPADPEKTIRVKTSDLKKIYHILTNPLKFFLILEEEVIFHD